MKVYVEQTGHGEVVSHPNVTDERDDPARRFFIRVAARNVFGKTGRFGRANSCAIQHLRRIEHDEGNHLGVRDNRQVDELPMGAVEQMNPLEGVGETAPSPQFMRAHLEEPLDDEQEKTGEESV